MALNDLYEHLLRNPPEKGTKMMSYAKKFIETKSYYNDFWFEMNNGYATTFKEEYINLITQVKKQHLYITSN